MKKFYVLFFNHARDTRTESKKLSEKEAERIYSDAKKSGRYSSVTLRVDEGARGYAIKSWSEEGGEVFLN